MTARYYQCVLSLAVVGVVLAAIAWGLRGDFSNFPEAVAWVLVVFGGLNFLGARRLFKPVTAMLREDALPASALRRIELLPWLTAGWTLVLSQLALLPPLYVERLICDGCPLDDLPLPAFLSLTGPIAVYSLFLAVYMFFLVRDYTARLKEHLFARRGIEFAPGRERLAATLAVAFVSVAFLPLSLFVFEPFFQARLGDMLGLQPNHTFWINVAASLFLTLSTLLFVIRSLAHPVRVLAEAVGRLARGQLRTRAPVITSDELGRLTASFNRMAHDLEDRALIRETFGRFVPEAVVEAILEDRGVMRPVARESTILFTDIEGFTSISEALEPEQVLTMLDDYFSAAGAVIRKHGGIVTQFQGDAILASFNLPVADPSHAESAVRAALEVVSMCRTRRFGGRTLNTRIGINTGPVVGGTVGGRERFGYTVHGDAVNLAARLEQLNKQYGTTCLVTQRTAELAGEEFDFEALGTVEVPGRTRPVTIYGLA
ncbi:MAG: adenylate/guanylate cyclase domain-containing protein [Arenicellales bacterium]